MTAATPTAPRGRSRRAFLRKAGTGLGAVGLAGCTSDPLTTSESGSSIPPGSRPATTMRVPIVPSEPSTSLASAKKTSTSAGPEPSDYIWTGARILAATAPIAAISGPPWLPPGLELDRPARATFYVAHYPLTAFESVYSEAAVFIHVKHRRRTAVHCPWMVVDDDTALILGRELLGFPRKMGLIELKEGEDTIVGTVWRDGGELMRLEADTSSLTPQPGRFWSDRNIVNVHGSIIGGMGLLDIDPLPEDVHERSTGTARITLGTTASDPLGELEPAGDAEAQWNVLDFGKLEQSLRFLAADLPGEYQLTQSLSGIRVQ